MAKRRLGPKREQQIEHARALGGRPECNCQSKLHRRGQPRDWGDPIFDQNDNALSSAEIGLVDGAGVGVDASALHVACEPIWCAVGLTRILMWLNESSRKVAMQERWARCRSIDEQAAQSARPMRQFCLKRQVDEQRYYYSRRILANEQGAESVASPASRFVLVRP